MSWIRSTVNTAVEVGGGGSGSKLSRTVRSYADSVVQQAGRAVAEGAKILHDRITMRNFQSFKHNVKRLEEVAVSCRGSERVLLLRRWLIALKEVEKLNGESLEVSGKGSEQLHISDESKDSPRKPVLVLYYDPDIGGEPLTFRDVFLHSQALEGMTLSMILEAPNEEEVKLLLEIYGLCLAGGGEVHSATMSSLQDLANAFASYEEEVLVKREELLEYAQGAISGLKKIAEIARIDSEVLEIQKNLHEMKPKSESDDDHDKSSTHSMVASIESHKEALAQVQLCSRLEALLLKKKLLNNGDSPHIHAQKVDKLKVLSESLANSASKTEKRILDHRLQKEEALKFRVTKSSEVNQSEKELVAELGMLERQRDELEAELKKVNTSITATRLRLHNAREEREQFDEASNEIMAHLKTKEDELSKSIACYRAEGDVCSIFVNFIEDTWAFQSKFTEQKEKMINDELEKYGTYFKDLVIRLLSAYKEELGSSISTFRELVEKLNSKERAIAAAVDDEDSYATNSRKNLEKTYVSSEAKFISTFSVVESIKKELYSTNEESSRHDNERVKELFKNIEKFKGEFDSIERPNLEIVTPQTKDETTPKVRPLNIKSPKSGPTERTFKGTYTPMHMEEIPENSPPLTPNLGLKSIEKSNTDLKTSSQTEPIQASTEKVQSFVRSNSENENSTQIIASPVKEIQSSAKNEEVLQSSTNGREKKSEQEADSSKFKKNSKQEPDEEIGGWELDELKKELKQ